MTKCFILVGLFLLVGVNSFIDEYKKIANSKLSGK